VAVLGYLTELLAQEFCLGRQNLELRSRRCSPLYELGLGRFDFGLYFRQPLLIYSIRMFVPCCMWSDGAAGFMLVMLPALGAVN
jgi:hypothetical protein